MRSHTGVRAEPVIGRVLREYKDSSRHGYHATKAEALQPATADRITGLAYHLARWR